MNQAPSWSQGRAGIWEYSPKGGEGLLYHGCLYNGRAKAKAEVGLASGVIWSQSLGGPLNPQGSIVYGQVGSKEVDWEGMVHEA